MMVLFSFSCRANREPSPPVIRSHSLSVELFPKNHTLAAADEMHILYAGKKLSLLLNRDFKIDSIIVDGRRADFRFIDIPENEQEEKSGDEESTSNLEKAGRVEIQVKRAKEHTVLIKYKGEVFEEPKAPQFSREYLASQTTGIVSEQGTFLSPESFWYPRADERMSTFSVQTKTPPGYESVTQGERLSREIKQGHLFVHWENKHPSDGLYLQAGPYVINEAQVEGIKIYTYFFPGSEKLSSLYLKKCKQYIAMYNRLLGRYPYQKFAVVENFFETGYGMPSWTLLGKTVIRLPFIPDTSLPHEICHNWWGNGVFVDYEKGNWCEGLTVYCADYLLKKMSTPGGDVDYRRQINRDYASYVRKNNDFALTEFRSRHNPSQRAVGYGKAMMVFHDLARRVGEERFFESLRQLMAEYAFKVADWSDVLGVFEKVCEVKLDDFYRQWIERAGAPFLWLTRVRSVRSEEGFVVSFTLIQEGEPYEIDVPVLVTTIDSEESRSVNLSKSAEAFSMVFASKPFRLEIDPDHHLFRKLHLQEIPPSLAGVFGSERQLIVLGSSESEEKQREYQQAAEMINKTGTAVIESDKSATKEELDKETVIIMGKVRENTPAAELLSKAERRVPWDQELTLKESATQVKVFRHPENSELEVMVISGNEKSDIISVARKLPHYGKYSYLLFHGEENVAKGIWGVEKSPLIYIF